MRFCVLNNDFKMKIIIKAIKKEEICLEIEANTLVRDVKFKIAELLRIPISRQKLLLLGRNLKDDTRVSDYPKIRNGTKLMLVEMPETREPLPILVQRHYRKYFNDYQSKHLTIKFMIQFRRRSPADYIFRLPDLIFL